MINKIRPIYQELMGYLSQAPLIKDTFYVNDGSLAEQLQGCIDQLNQITGQDYSRFKMTISGNHGGRYFKSTEYRSKLNGLIMNLHAQYFNDDPAPFSGTPNTIITQNQQQSTQVIILLEIQSLIYEKLNKVQDEKEKGFLESVKSKLSGIKNVAELMQLITTTAKSFGLTIDQLVNIFT